MEAELKRTISTTRRSPIRMMLILNRSRPTTPMKISRSRMKRKKIISKNKHQNRKWNNNQSSHHIQFMSLTETPSTESETWALSNSSQGGVLLSKLMTLESCWIVSLHSEEVGKSTSSPRTSVTVSSSKSCLTFFMMKELIAVSRVLKINQTQSSHWKLESQTGTKSTPVSASIISSNNSSLSKELCKRLVKERTMCWLLKPLENCLLLCRAPITTLSTMTLT